MNQVHVKKMNIADKSHSSNSYFNAISNPEELRKYLDISGLSKVGIDDLSYTDANNVISSYIRGEISTDIKNKIIATIINCEWERGNKDYILRIHNNNWKINCLHCDGLGFRIIEEVELKPNSCHDDHHKDVLDCYGTGIKTMRCSRCNGMTLKDIVAMKQRIICVATQNEERKFGHFRNLDTSKIPENKLNDGLTYQVVKNADNGLGQFSFIVLNHHCGACDGTGRFIQHGKGIKCICGGKNKKCKRCGGTGRFDKDPVKCPVCAGKKHFEHTGHIRHFFKCNHCDGNGSLPMNPAFNPKKFSPEVKTMLAKITL